MVPSLNEHRVSPVLRVVLIALGIAVFAWGLQYKLSLYQEPSSPNLKVAKLMQGEQPNKKVTAFLLRNRHTSSQLELERAVAVFVPPLAVQPHRPTEKLVPAFVSFTPPSRFVRPPPFLS